MTEGNPGHRRDHQRKHAAPNWSTGTDCISRRMWMALTKRARRWCRGRDPPALYIHAAGPRATRWYHTHAMAGHNLAIGSYSGQFGMLVIAARLGPWRDTTSNSPSSSTNGTLSFVAATDPGLPHLLHQWQDAGCGRGRCVCAPRARPRSSGAVLNTSATNPHCIALPGHRFSSRGAGRQTSSPRHGLCRGPWNSRRAKRIDRDR